jgi:Tol biopolymer transport system component
MVVMISYARTDLSAVLALAADLERAHEDVWVDRELAGGQVWWDAILEQIRLCDVYLAALSPSFLDSRACRSELEYAVRLARPILPVMVDDVAIQLAPPVIANAQIVDYRTRSVDSAIALVSAVKGRAAAPPLPTPLPVPPDPPISYMNSFSERIDADSLSYTEQLHLVAELKAYLDRSSDQAVAAQLLQRLRRRTDISEGVGRDIDTLLRTLAVGGTETARGLESEQEETQQEETQQEETQQEETQQEEIQPEEIDQTAVLSPTDVDEHEAEDESGPAPPDDLGNRRRRLAILTAVAAVVLIMIVAVAAALLDNSPIVSKNPDELPASAALAPSQLIVPMQVEDGTWALHVADTTSSSPGPRLTAGDGYTIGPVVSPDRRTLIYVSADDDKTLRRSLRVAGAADLRGDRQLSSLPGDCERALRPAWNPADPTMIALICVSADREYVLRLVSIADGTVIRQIEPPEGKPRMGDPAFSHDGRWLGFWAAPTGPLDGGTLYRVPTAGGSPEPLLDPANADGRDSDLVFSPDERYVAFTRRPPSADSGGHAGIFRARSDGSKVTALTGDAEFDRTDPTWSPDSDQVAYISTARTSAWPDRPVPRVWTMTRDGKKQRVLWTQEAPGPQAAPGWTAR